MLSMTPRNGRARAASPFAPRLEAAFDRVRRHDPGIRAELEALLDEATAAGDLDAVAEAMVSLAIHRHISQESRGVEGLLEDAIAYFRRSNPGSPVLSRAWSALATFQAKAGQFARALDSFQQALSAARAAGDQAALLRVENNRSLLLIDMERYDLAITYLSEALSERNAAHRSPLETAQFSANLALAYRRKGMAGSAREWLGLAEGLAERHGFAYLRPYLLAEKAELATAEGDLDTAAGCLQEVIDGEDGSVELVDRIARRLQLGELQLRRGDGEGALAVLARLRELPPTDNTAILARLHRLAAAIHERRGELRPALDSYRELLALPADPAPAAAELGLLREELAAGRLAFANLQQLTRRGLELAALDPGEESFPRCLAAAMEAVDAEGFGLVLPGKEGLAVELRSPAAPGGAEGSRLRLLLAGLAAEAIRSGATVAIQELRVQFLPHREAFPEPGEAGTGSLPQALLVEPLGGPDGAFGAAFAYNRRPWSFSLERQRAFSLLAPFIAFALRRGGTAAPPR